MNNTVKKLSLITGIFLIGISLLIMGLALFSWFASNSLKSYEPQILIPHVLIDHQIYHGNHGDSTVWKYCVETEIDNLLEYINYQLPDAEIFEHDSSFMVYKRLDSSFIQFLTHIYFYANPPSLTLEAISSRDRDCKGVWYYVTYQIEHH